MPVPEHLAERPPISPGLVLYWDGFADLKRGLGTDPIRFKDIIWYCDRFGIEGDQLARFVEMVEFLDLEYNRLVSEQTPGGRPQQGQGGDEGAE